MNTDESPKLDIFNFRLQSARGNLTAMASLMQNLAKRNDHLRDLRQELAFESSRITRRLKNLKDQVEAIKTSLMQFGNPPENPGIPQIASNAGFAIETIDDLNGLFLNARIKWKEVSIAELYPSDVAASGGEFEKKIKDSNEKLDEIELTSQNAQIKSWNDLKSLGDFWSSYLDYVAGLSLRHEGLDSGVCDIADAMIRELQGHSGALSALAIPGRESSLVSPPKIVILRFPEWTVWSLPLTAHELWLIADSGAVIASSFYIRAFQSLSEGEDSPFERWTEVRNTTQSKQTRKPTKDLVTYLADAFATLTLGPAYAWSALLLDLDPVEKTDHFRALVILDTLSQLNDADAQGAFAKDLTQLKEIWQDAIEQAGGKFVPLGKGLVEWTRFLIFKLKKDIPGLGFPVATWASEKARDPWVDYFLGKGMQPPIAGSDIRFALNAAWKARIGHPGSAEDIAERCYKLCIKMAERPTPSASWSGGAPGAWPSASR